MTLDYRVAVTSDAFRFQPGLYDELRAHRFEPHPCEQVRPTTNPHELAKTLSGSWAVIAGVERYNGSVFSACPQLRVIARPGVGVDSIDLEAASRAGIAVCVTPGANAASVADMTLTMMLAATRRLIELDASTRSGGWRPSTLGSELSSAAIGLVGLGAIGRLVAQRLSGFGCVVRGADATGVAVAGVELCSLADLLATSSVVSLHLPLTASTRHILGAPEFAQMRPGTVIINTSRGGLIDETALVAALESGIVGAAALDVFETEPPLVDSPLLKHSNVTLSPHLAGFTVESVSSMGRESIANLVDIRAGRVTERCVNRITLQSLSSEMTSQ